MVRAIFLRENKRENGSRGTKNGANIFVFREITQKSSSNHIVFHDPNMYANKYNLKLCL